MDKERDLRLDIDRDSSLSSLPLACSCDERTEKRPQILLLLPCFALQTHVTSTQATKKPTRKGGLSRPAEDWRTKRGGEGHV